MSLSVQRENPGVLPLGRYFYLVLVLPILVEAQGVLRVDLPSFMNGRHFYPAYLFSKGPESKGLIVQIYGGGCMAPSEPEVAQLTSATQMLLTEGFDVLKLDYRAYINWPEVNDEHRARLCRDATFTYMADFVRAIEIMRDNKIYKEKPFFVLGFSYGGFITNLLASSPHPIPGVRAYVSIASRWDPLRSTPPQVINHIVPESLRPVDHRPQDLAPILLIYARDDRTVSFDHLNIFQEWARSQASTYRILEVNGTGHMVLESDSHLPLVVGTIVKFFKSFQLNDFDPIKIEGD